MISGSCYTALRLVAGGQLKGSWRLPKLVHAGGLMLASEAALVSFSVAGDMQRMLGLQLFDLLLDRIPTRPWAHTNNLFTWALL